MLFVKSLTNVCFVASQPLGYYSSCLLFAHSHHIFVWHYVGQVHPSLCFDKYEVLGGRMLSLLTPKWVQFVSSLIGLKKEMSLNICH